MSQLSLLAEDRERVLLVTRNFPPVVGGMERLLFNTWLQLQTEFSVALLAPRGAESFVGNHSMLTTVPLKPLPAFLISSLYHAQRMARRYRPNVILSGSGLTAPQALVAGRLTNTPVVCFVHGLDVVAKSAVYQGVFVPALRHCDRIIANSRNTARLAENAGVPPNRIEVLPPGVDLPSPGRLRATETFRRRIGAGSRPLLLSVGRLSPRKGIAEFIAHSFPDIVAARPDILLIIIGDDPKNAVQDQAGQASHIRKIVADRNLGDHVLMLGTVSDETLHDAYAAASLLIFPVLDIPGDVEGFGMVAIEAAAHGLPTAAFATGGIPDAIVDTQTGYLASSGNYQELTRHVVNHLTAANQQTWSARCRLHSAQFQWSRYGQRLRTLLRRVTQENSARPVDHRP